VVNVFEFVIQERLTPLRGPQSENNMK